MQRVKRYAKLNEWAYREMLEQQAGCCAICGSPDPQAIDHDHVTGDVRGILCTRCNTGLGKFMDDPELLRVAAQYLAACYNSTAELTVQRYAVKKGLRRSRRHARRHTDLHDLVVKAADQAKP